MSIPDPSFFVVADSLTQLKLFPKSNYVFSQLSQGIVGKGEDIYTWTNGIHLSKPIIIPRPVENIVTYYSITYRNSLIVLYLCEGDKVYITRARYYDDREDHKVERLFEGLCNELNTCFYNAPIPRYTTGL